MKKYGLSRRRAEKQMLELCVCVAVADTLQCDLISERIQFIYLCLQSNKMCDGKTEATKKVGFKAKAILPPPSSFSSSSSSSLPYQIVFTRFGVVNIKLGSALCMVYYDG
jgi:hypothetical protein